MTDKHTSSYCCTLPWPPVPSHNRSSTPTWTEMYSTVFVLYIQYQVIKVSVCAKQRQNPFKLHLSPWWSHLVPPGGSVRCSKGPVPLNILPVKLPLRLGRGCSRPWVSPWRYLHPPQIRNRSGVRSEEHQTGPRSDCQRRSLCLSVREKPVSVSWKISVFSDATGILPNILPVLGCYMCDDVIQYKQLHLLLETIVLIKMEVTYGNVSKIIVTSDLYPPHPNPKSINSNCNL